MPLNRILVLHNRYREPGGEDRAVEQEVALLRAHGHEVIEYVDSNRRLDESHPLAAAWRAIWSRGAYRRVRQAIAETRPQLAHFHNTFCMISPAAYYACRGAGLPVVQTLHNFRLGCLNACCTRDGRTCDVCVSSRLPWRGIWHGCYRASRQASAAVAAVGFVHKGIGTYRSQVDAYISTSQFARGVHVRCGVPAELSFVKPNFSARVPPGASNPGGYVLYAGRLVPEKGVYVLLEAWRRLNPRPRLKVAGDGPEAGRLRARYGDMPEVEFLGALTAAQVRGWMEKADFLVQPSLVWENCALAVIEAFGAGLPCIVSGHGSLAEMVEDGRSGLHFCPGDADDLAGKIGWLAAHEDQRTRMARAARDRFEQLYTPEKNYAQLMAIYGAAKTHRDGECR